jgi:hypothetical protein
MSDTTNNAIHETTGEIASETTSGSLPASPSVKPAGESFIEPARLKKAKRTKIVLIIVIVLLVGALGYLGYLGYTIFMEGMTNGPGSIKPVDTITGGEIDDPNAPQEVRVAKTSIPDLVPLFGLSVEEVRTRLGADFQLSKTDAITDETNPAVRQLATFSYIPSVSGDTNNAAPNTSLPSESIYASLNEEGKVVDIYYVCDMLLLGYPERSFDELLAGSEMVIGALEDAGVQTREFDYIAPDPQESIVYDNPNSANRKVVKQTHIFSGRTSTSTLPTVWTLTVTYDFGAGATSTTEFRQATRTINLKLA